jgi:hypothetical protein
MSVTINGTNGLVFNDNSTQTTAATGFGFKNRIINGDMRIDQRNNGASVTPGTGTYTLDRWRAYQNVAGKFTVQQSSVAPAGFTNSALITSTSAYTASGTDLFLFMQYIEGFNAADLGWGTANAQTVTLSFQVRSSLTGTFGGAIVNSAENRNYPFTYTISVANTFETKSVTIPGDTSGTWLTTNGVGIQVNFGIGAGTTYSGTAGAWAAGAKFTATGATSVVGTNGATFYVTGVDIRKGSTGAYPNGANEFDYRPYGTEFFLCCRYFQKLVEPALCGYAPTGTSVWRMGGVLPVQMRAAGTVTITGNPPIQSAGATSLTAVGTNYSNNGNSIEFDGTLNASVTVNGSIIKTICSSSNTSINISAEL